MPRSQRTSLATTPVAAAPPKPASHRRKTDLVANGNHEPVSPVQPSAKALGKRREMYSAADETSATEGGAQEPRKKRVLPLRARRTGLGGVGSSSIDEMILDVQQRAGDEPIVPRSSVFVLTTDESGLPPPEEPMFPSVDDRAEARRPPEASSSRSKPGFILLSEIELVPGRLRPRTRPEEAGDTSDAAYAARHRKYEALERRQRRREKEKLIHEHYKLKERIEQLRVLDASAFGGEEKKRAMLVGAEELDRRYDVLLPKEGKGTREKEKEKEREKEREREGVGGGEGRTPSEQPAGLKLKLKLSSSYNLSRAGTAASSPRPPPSQASKASSIEPNGISLPPARTTNAQRDPSTGRFMPTPPKGKPRFSTPSSQLQRAPTPLTPVPILVQAALRTSRSERSMRRPTAFGVPLPAGVDEEHEFRIPEWLGVDTDDDDEKEESEMEVDQEL